MLTLLFRGFSMDSRGQHTSRGLSGELLGRALLLAVAFCGLKALSAFFIFAPQQSASVWLPSGLTLAVFLRAEKRRWPVYLVAIFLAELLLVPLYGASLGMALFWALGNCARTLVGAGLMRRWLDQPVTFSRPRDVAGLLVAGGLLSPLPSATLGMGAVALFAPTSPEAFWQGWMRWYLSDGLGAVLLAPLLLTWRAERFWPRRSWPRLELGVTLLLLALAAHATFGVFEPRGALLCLPYACLPFLVWAALRLGPRGASSATLVLGTLAVVHTAAGRGPFGVLPVTLEERVLSVQVFLAVSSLSTLLLCALACERRRVERIQRLLADVGTVLAESLKPGDTLPRVARLVVPELASGVVIWLKDEEGRLVPAARVGVEPALEARLREEVRGVVFASRRRLGPEGASVVARIQHRGRVLGGLALVMAGRTHPLHARSATFVEDLAHHCALALENARLLSESQQALQARDEFIAVAAHELRTPITALKLQLQSLLRLLRQSPAGEDVLSRFHAVARQVSRLGRLVESLLDVERIHTGRLRLEREPVDLGELVQDVVERFNGELARAGCELRVKTLGRVTGMWDRTQLEQALGHLLGNALKFGAGHPIELTLESRDAQARLTVRDHGLGLAPEALERIFGRFERARSSRESGGLGLGLFLTRQIAEAHGGRFQVLHRPGTGATFLLELPACPLPSSSVPERASTPWPSLPTDSHPT
jgi:signal transduction histidine kinase